MSTNAEGVIETDELPVGKTNGTEPIVETQKPIEPETPKTPVAPATPEPIPENVETEEAFTFLKPETVVEEKVIEEKTAEETAEEIFTEDLFEEKQEEQKPTDIPVSDFISEFITEAGDLFGDVKISSAKELADALKTKIDAAKTIVEIDTTKYTTEQLALHQHLQTEKGVVEFVDLAAPYLNFLSLSEDEKVKSYLIHEKGVKEENIQDEFDKLVDADEWDSTVKTINETILQLKDQAISTRVNQITTEAKTLAEKNSSIVVTEQTAMISALDEMNDFMGMKLPDSFKAQLKKEITTGQFTQKNNNARTQVKARLYDLVGDKIMSQFQQSLETERELAFNRGLEKGQGTLYNKPPKTNSPGHVKPTDDNYKDEKAGFRGIDADAIDTSR